MDNYYKWHEQNVHINLLVQPRASADQVIGVHGNQLKVKITANPVNDEGNQHLCEFLAHYFGVAKTHVSIIRGSTNKNKVVCIQNPKKNRPE